MYGNGYLRYVQLFHSSTSLASISLLTRHLSTFKPKQRKSHTLKFFRSKENLYLRITTQSKQSFASCVTLKGFPCLPWYYMMHCHNPRVSSNSSRSNFMDANSIQKIRMFRVLVANSQWFWVGRLSGSAVTASASKPNQQTTSLFNWSKCGYRLCVLFQG